MKRSISENSSCLLLITSLRGHSRREIVYLGSVFPLVERKIGQWLVCGGVLLCFNEPHSQSSTSPNYCPGLERLIDLSVEHLPDHGLEEPGPVSDGGHGLVHQWMHLDEVECVVGEFIGNLVPLHGWRACAVARPANGEEEREVMRRRSDEREKKINTHRKKHKRKPLH